MTRLGHWLARHWPLAVLGVLVLAGLLWGMLAPLGRPHHALVLRLGGLPGSLPASLVLTRGVQDVLLVRNTSAAPAVFGPLTLPPGAERRLPFEQAGSYEFACPGAPGGRVRVQVEEAPLPGAARLRWRLGQLEQDLRHIPVRAPVH